MTDIEIQAMACLTYFVYNLMIFDYASKVLYNCSKNRLIHISFSIINVFGTIFLFSTSFSNNSFMFYFTCLLVLMLECKLITQTSFKQVLFGTSIFVLHIAIVHFTTVIIIAHIYEIPPIQVLNDINMRIFCLLFTCIVLIIILIIIKKFIPLTYIIRISDAKNYSLMISIFATIEISLVTLVNYLLFTNELFQEQLIIGIITPVFYLAIFYYTFLYAINFVNMTMYKRQSDKAQIVYDEVLKEKEKALEKATKDSLTGLYNKQFGHETIEALCKGTVDFGILFIDINGLKYVNDNYSHESGDILITSVADAINNAKRDIDIAARFGGDEFVIVLKQISSNDIDTVVKRIYTQIEIKNNIEPFPVSASIGSIFVDNNLRIQGADLVLDLADRKMLEIKRKFYLNGGGFK